MIRRLAGLAVLALLVAAPVQAQQAAPQPALPDTVEAFGVAVEGFVKKHNLRRATVTVRRNGRTIYEKGFGGDDPKQPRLLASLSKAITATCAATLIEQGRLRFDTTVREGLRAFLARQPAPKDARLLDVTFAELITHTSGLAGNFGDGEAGTRKILIDTILAHGVGADSTRRLGAETLKLGLKRDRGAYRYSNDGYTLAGLMIEEVTGQSYEQACTERVLKPAGAQGRLHADWAILGPYAGWSMTGADYLAFFDTAFRDARVIGQRAFAWQVEGKGKGYRFPNSAIWYGLGVNSREAGQARNVWHWGEWEMWYRRANGPRVEADFNTFATRAGQHDTSWFVSFEPHLENEQRRELDPLMWTALRAVKRW